MLVGGLFLMQQSLCLQGKGAALGGVDFTEPGIIQGHGCLPEEKKRRIIAASTPHIQPRKMRPRWHPGV
jgi:hypothetical protein